MPMGTEDMFQLTIIVPAYNAEMYLKKCLDSMADKDPRLEVIIVNDGSTDRTRQIAEKFAADFPQQFQVINKENGGHGSAINAGVERAQGRYFKVIDADDWIAWENLTRILDALANSEADAVVTGYHTVDMRTGRKTEFPSLGEFGGREIGLAELPRAYDLLRDCFSFHGLFYRTALYKAAGIQLSEGVFYEDQEYATLPFAYVNSILILPWPFYQYLIGNSGQSVSYQNQVKRIGDIEAVIRKIIRYRQDHLPMEQERDTYFLEKLSIVVTSYFSTALVKNPDRKAGKRDADRFSAWLSQAEPELIRRTAKKYKTLQIFHALHLSPKLYQSLLNTPLYKKVRRAWTK